MDSENLNGVASNTKTKDLDRNNAITPSKAKEEKNGKHLLDFSFETR